jgi:hypothetical protein
MGVVSIGVKLVRRYLLVITATQMEIVRERATTVSGLRGCVRGLLRSKKRSVARFIRFLLIFGPGLRSVMTWSIRYRTEATATLQWRPY